MKLELIQLSAMLHWKIQLQVSVHLFISSHTGETGGRGGGALGFLVVCHFVRPSVCLSVRPSVRLGVRPLGFPNFSHLLLSIVK